MKDFDIYSFVIIYYHFDYHDDKVYKRIVVRANSPEIADKIVRRHAMSFSIQHKLYDYCLEDIVLIEKNFKTVNDFRLH